MQKESINEKLFLQLDLLKMLDQYFLSISQKLIKIATLRLWHFLILFVRKISFANEKYQDSMRKLDWIHIGILFGVVLCMAHLLIQLFEKHTIKCFSLKKIGNQ